MRYKGNGYITDLRDFKISKHCRYSIWHLTSEKVIDINLSQDEREMYFRFLSHVYLCGHLNIKSKLKSKMFYVPIPSRLLRDIFKRKFKLDVVSHLLRKTNYSYTDKRCREYRLKEGIMTDFFNTKKDLKPEEIAFLESISNISKTDLKDVRGNYNPIISKSIRCLRPFPINLTELDKLSDRLSDKAASLNSIMEDGEKRFKPNSKKMKAIYKKADSFFIKAMPLKFNLEQIRDSVVSEKKDKVLIGYSSAHYKLQKTGRITEIGGGFQNADKYLKHILIKDLNLYNYDLKNSQALFLLEELWYSEIKCLWLKKYLADPKKMKNKLAEKIGIPVSVFKNCFYAMIMGANPKLDVRVFNKAIQQYIVPGSVYRYIYEYCKKDVKRAKTLHRAFLREIKALNLAVKRWRDYIYSSKDLRYNYTHSRVKYWKNACDMKYKEFGIVNNELLSFDEDRDPNKETCKREIAAFMLQGLEAVFIHNLIIECSEKGIPVYRNEYDGLITGRPIPEKLVDKISKKLNLKFKPLLELKPICSEKLVKKYEKFLSKKIV